MEPYEPPTEKRHESTFLAAKASRAQNEINTQTKYYTTFFFKFVNQKQSRLCVSKCSIYEKHKQVCKSSLNDS